MQLKVTLRYVIVLIKVTLVACNTQDPEEDLIRYNERLDSLASRRIDTAYKDLSRNCDTLIKYRLPQIVDSLLKEDSLKHD